MTTAPATINAAIVQQAREAMRVLAASNLQDFVAYTKPDYEFGWFNELLCRELDQFLLDVEAGKMPRLMIFAPPRSGKSEVVSRRFPAYVLGKRPQWNVIGASYSADLANRMSRDAQRIVDGPAYREIFPETNLTGANVKTSAGGAIRTVDLWETIGPDGRVLGGSYRASGVGGGITGQGMNIGIIDDPAKDYQQASSKKYQETVKDWYDTTLSTRADPRLNGVIVILTRWHKNDLAGQLLEEAANGGEQWRVVSFPMVAEADEYHELKGKKYRTRRNGELLFPERMPADFVAKARLRGSLVWNALYQQRPTQKGGALIQTSQFQYYDVLPKMKWRAIYADTAQKTEEQHDFTVLEHWGLGTDGYCYLLDVVRGKWEADALKVQFVAFWNRCKALDRVKFGPLNGTRVEDKSSGTGLIQSIRKSANPAIPVKAIQRSRDKYTRFLDIQGYIESGYVMLPRNASWLSDFLMECEELTANFDTHDDQIDPMMDAIDEMMNHTSRGIFG